MAKKMANKIAEEYVLSHRDSFAATVVDKQIQRAVAKVAKALRELEGRAGKIGRAA